jgi:protein-S-isoprenylcysteine O-methyltransferase Ste14
VIAGVFLALTAAWIAAEALATLPEPDLIAPREVATGQGLLAVHAGGLAEHLLRGTPGAWAGALVIGAGVALRVAAIVTLGPAFSSSELPPPRRITAGVYRAMRHPSELGLLLAAAGAALLLGSVLAAALTVFVLAPLSLHRSAAESRWLGVTVRAR